jgi:hypothetical protein
MGEAPGLIVLVLLGGAGGWQGEGAALWEGAVRKASKKIFKEEDKALPPKLGAGKLKSTPC